MAKQTIDELAVIITANSERLPGDLAKARKDFEQFAKSMEKALGGGPPPKPPDMSAHKKAAQDAAAHASSIRQSFASVAGFAGKVAATGGTLVALELGLAGVAGAFEQLKQSVRMAADLEQTTVSFEVMLGSARRAQKMLTDIRQYAATTPFNNRELTAAARQLIAYGFAADSVMPTLKMLGDVSAASGKAIGDVAYLYGTLRTQGRAYQKDINQFTGAGIDLLPALAAVMGKQQFELKGLIEEGRIEFTDVEAAFRRMTSEGGRYFQMTARQGQTLAGVLEQTADAFDLLKLEFGKVLVEELGIKEAAKDLEAFAGRLRASTDEIRPAVRFAGDLAKAGAQISYEFGRAGLTVAALNVDALDRTFPGLKGAVDSFRQMVKEAQDFKFDEEKLINFGANVADVTVRTFGAIADTISNMWKAAEESAAPLLRTMQRLDAMATWLGSGRAQPTPGSAPDRATLFPAYGGVDRTIPPAPPPGPPPGRRDSDPAQYGQFGLPVPGMSPDRVFREYAALTAEIRAAEQAVKRAEDNPFRVGGEGRRQLNDAEARLASARRSIAAYEGGFVRHPERPTGDLLRAGMIPPIKGAPGDPDLPPVRLSDRDGALSAALGPAGLFPGQAKTFAQTAREAVEEMRQTMLAASRQRREAQAATVEAAANRAAALYAGIGPASLFRVPADVDAQDRQAARVAALGSAAALPPLSPPRQEIADLGLHLRREYDPRPELELYRRQLDELKARQLMGPDTNALVDRAWRDKLGEAAGRMGIDSHGRYQLPEATSVGSAEDARIITAWRTQGQNPSSEQLWQRITTAVETLVMIETQRGVRLPVAPAPRVVQIQGE